VFSPVSDFPQVVAFFAPVQRLAASFLQVVLSDLSEVVRVPEHQRCLQSPEIIARLYFHRSGDEKIQVPQDQNQSSVAERSSKM